MEELWTEIKGFNGYYISNHGNVKSIKRGKEKLLKQKINKYGYKEVSLQNDDYSSTMKRVNRLVAEAFIPNPLQLEEVNHKDQDKLNNNVENLEWLSHGDNSRYTLSKPLVQILNGEIIKVWDSITDVHNILGFSQASISRVCNGKAQKSHGYVWRFI